MQQVYRSLPHEPAAAILVRDLLSIQYFLPPRGWHPYVAHDAARICDDAVSLRLPSNDYTFEMDTGSLGRLSGLIRYGCGNQHHAQRDFGYDQRYGCGPYSRGSPTALFLQRIVAWE